MKKLLLSMLCVGVLALQASDAGAYTNSDVVKKFGPVQVDPEGREFYPGAPFVSSASSRGILGDVELDRALHNVLQAEDMIAHYDSASEEEQARLAKVALLGRHTQGFLRRQGVLLKQIKSLYELYTYIHRARREEAEAVKPAEEDLAPEEVLVVA